MNPEELLITQMDLLARAALDPAAESVLHMSAILRQLLLDASASPVHQANRSARLKLRYQCSLLSPLPQQWYAHDDLDPLWPVLRPAQALTESKFLALHVATLRGQAVTVRDVIKIAANVFGGVHAGSPRDVVQQRIAEAEAADPGAVLECSLRPISRIVLRGLAPLRAKLLGLRRFEGAKGFALMMNIGIDAASPAGDLDLCRFGEEPEVRVIVDRDGVLRAIAHVDGESILLTSAQVPTDREFWFQIEIGSQGSDLLFRSIIDEVEFVKLLPGAGGGHWRKLTNIGDGKMVGSIGYPTHGSFRAARILCFSSMLRPEDVAKLRQHRHEHRVANRVVFGPEQGLDIGRGDCASEMNEAHELG